MHSDRNQKDEQFLCLSVFSFKSYFKEVFGDVKNQSFRQKHLQEHVDHNSEFSGWEVIAEDESKEADQNSSLANLDSSPGTSGHKMGHGSSGK